MSLLRSRRTAARRAVREQTRRQQAARVERAVRRSHLRDRTAGYDWAAELDRQQRGRST